jgi:predicted CoA-substrate-specific enzyme activase
MIAAARPHLEGKGIERTGCTGYGRKLYAGAGRIFSEISCHAAGVLHFFPAARTIIDIGGQDSKLISLDDSGKVRDFVMNDKCAAGTGRFLEMTALRLDCTLDELSELAAGSTEQLSISSTCVVFAESEIIGLIAENHAKAGIAKAVHMSVAARILTQISALDYREPIVFTGGVALNRDLADSLAKLLGTEILVSPHPLITGALGAARLIAREG